MEYLVEDQNCTERTIFRVETNSLEIETFDDSGEPITMKFSEIDTRNLIKWLAHATNYRS